MRERETSGQVPAFMRCAAWGALGALPWAVGVPEPLAVLAWIALIAVPAGVHLGARGVGVWPFGVLAPGLWMIELAWLDAAGEGTLSTPLFAALAWTGLFGLGLALGAQRPEAGWRRAGALLLAGGLLAFLPLAGGAGGMLAGRTVGEAAPALAALLFDLSPPVLLAESAGVDFMRTRGVYGRAGTEWFSDRRGPWRGILAGPALLLVGCTAAFAARRRRAPGPE